MSDYYKSEDIQKYTNFFMTQSLISNIVRYLSSNFRDDEITNLLCNDCALLKLPVTYGRFPDCLAVRVAKLLPLKTIIWLLKRK